MLQLVWLLIIIIQSFSKSAIPRCARGAYSARLYYTILYYTILYYTILYYYILYYIILYYIILYYIILYYIIIIDYTIESTIRYFSWKHGSQTMYTRTEEPFCFSCQSDPVKTRPTDRWHRPGFCTMNHPAFIDVEIETLEKRKSTSMRCLTPPPPNKTTTQHNKPKHNKNPLDKSTLDSAGTGHQIFPSRPLRDEHLECDICVYALRT